MSAQSKMVTETTHFTFAVSCLTVGAGYRLVLERRTNE